MPQSIKSACQSALQRAGLYQRVKSSALYDIYWRIVDARLIEARNEEVEFFRNTLAGLKKDDLIFDIGANLGHKTDIFLRLGVQVVAVDPDKLNQQILKERFLTYRLRRKPVRIVGQAISDRTGVEKMWVDEPGSAKNTLNAKWVTQLRSDETRFGAKLSFGQEQEVETTTLERLIETFGRPFYIKIDVEGHEPSVLRGLKQSVPFLSFEVNLPDFRAEGLECIDLLRELDADGEFNYAADLRGGLLLPQWLPHTRFLPVFEQVQQSSVEVFWRSDSGRG